MSVLSGFFLFLKTGLSGFVVSSCGFLSFQLFYFEFGLLLYFSFLSNKQEKTDKNMLAQLCSRIVFLILGGWALKYRFLPKTL